MSNGERIEKMLQNNWPAVFSKEAEERLLKAHPHLDADELRYLLKVSKLKYDSPPVRIDLICSPTLVVDINRMLLMFPPKHIADLLNIEYAIELPNIPDMDIVYVNKKYNPEAIKMSNVQETAKQNIRDLLNVYDVDYIDFNVRDNQFSIALKEKSDQKEK